MQKFKAILFDLDGTLLNTLEDLAESVNSGLREMGLPVHSLETFKYLVGEGREEMVRKSLPADRRSSTDSQYLLDWVNRYYLAHWHDHTLPYPGVPEMLNQLQAGAIALSIFSNKPQEFTSLNVAGLLGKWQFAVVLGASAETPRKPDCSGALRIARELALPPADFIYLGDSGIDMQTAVRAGMYGVGALWGFRTAEELRANGAKSLAQKPQDILQFFA